LQDGGQLHSDVPVEVYVMSSVDRPPRFEERDTVYYVNENSPVGRMVAQFSADADGDDNEEEEEEEDIGVIIKYSIASTGKKRKFRTTYV
jgi:hypothetical protein